MTLVYNAVIADSSHSHGMDPQQNLNAVSEYLFRSCRLIYSIYQISIKILKVIFKAGINYFYTVSCIQ